MIAEPQALIRTFAIGERDFLLQGNPFVVCCGEIHFPRVPREYWRHRLATCRAMGLNTVCVYLFWNFHEWEEGRFDWEGQADAAEFCRLAQEENLWVLLRPGPYSCAEWEMGGLPWWLAKREVSVRSTDPQFLAPAIRYLKEVGRVLAPLQVTRGGPILMAQVENEYGSFGSDVHYMGALRDAMVEGGFEVPLFACDPPGDLAKGHRSDLFKVVNFGTGAAETAFAKLRELQQTGPLMNGEYYPAWFDMWGRRHRSAPPKPIVDDLAYMLKNRNSFSIYMAHGGTSFGLWAGADRPFSPDTSSYDYDAPISEAGWVTPKFEAIRNLMSRFPGTVGTLPAPPAANPVIEVPPFSLDACAPVFDNLPEPVFDRSPRPMEVYEQSRGMTLYRVTIPAGPAELLNFRAVHDFAWSFLDGNPVGVMDRRSKRYSLPIPERAQPAQLDVLVYAMGRVNFGSEVMDRKGLHGPAFLGGDELLDWSIYRFPLDTDSLEGLRFGPPREGPAFWRGQFEVKEVGDFFLDVRSWGKGVVWINGHALGRYWNIGPTQTMYVPGPWLREGQNEVVVLDLLGPSARVLRGLTRPVLDEVRPDLDFARPGRATGLFQPPCSLAEGAFPHAPQWQYIPLSARGRYLCFEATLVGGKRQGVSIAEIELIDAAGKVAPKDSWTILWTTSEETNYLPGEAENAIDGQNATCWHTEQGTPGPHRIVIHLGESIPMSGLRVLPGCARNTEWAGTIEWRVYVDEQPFGLSLRE